MNKETRIDCHAFAKCGNKSLAHCRRYRDKDPECKGCALLVRRVANRKYDSNGREMKRCIRCHRYYYFDKFYDFRIKRGGKLYKYKSSRCRMCVTRINNERYKTKMIKSRIKL